MKHDVEKSDSPFSEEGIMRFISVDPNIREQGLEDLQREFNNKYLADHQRLINELDALSENIGDDQVRNLRVFLDGGKEFSDVQLANIPNTQMAIEHDELRPLVEVIKSSTPNYQHAETGEEGRCHRRALFFVAKHKREVVERWISRSIDDTREKGQLSNSSVRLAYNLFLAGWLTNEPKNARAAHRLFFSELSPEDERKFAELIFDYSTRAAKVTMRLDQITQKDWRKNGKAKKRYRQMYGVPIPRQQSFFERTLWDGEFRWNIWQKHPDLLEHEDVVVTVSMLQHYIHLEETGVLQRDMIYDLLDLPFTGELLHPLRTIQPQENRLLWQLLTSRGPMQFAGPPSKTEITDDIDSKKVFLDRDYLLEKAEEAREAFYAALCAIYPDGDLRPEGLSNTTANRSSVAVNFLGQSMFGDSMTRSIPEFWEQAHEIEEIVQNIANYGDKMISVQGDRFHISRNPHLHDLWLDSITLWEADDKFPGLDGFAAEIQLRGVKEPFTFILDENLDLYYEDENGLCIVVLPLQLLDFYRHLILMHAEAIKVGQDTDDETKRTRKGNAKIMETDRDKYGPHYSRIPTGTNRVKKRWKYLEREAEMLRLHYPSFPPDIAQAVRDKIRELKEENGEEVKELYDDEFFDPLLLHFTLSTKFKYKTWKIKELRSMGQKTPRRVMVKKGRNHDYLVKQDPEDVTLVQEV
jgi:hypothetical protein